MFDSKKMVSSLFYFFLDFTTITIFGYLFWIIMGKFLLPEQYGLLATIIALFTVFVNISTLGMQEALPKFIPEYLAKGENKQAVCEVIFD